MLKKNIPVTLMAALAVVHFFACLFFRPLLLSNAIQLIAAGMTTVLCLRRARQSAVSHFRWLWCGLGIAFALWTIGQAYDVWYIAVYRAPLGIPSPADCFWMLYSFPILLVASQAEDRVARDWTSVLDWLQACISIGLVYAIILMIPESGIVDRVYDILGIALLFACAIRYSTARGAKERIFFRNLTIYVTSYGALGLATQVMPSRFVQDGGIRDIAFSWPFLIFCVATIRFPERLTSFLDDMSVKMTLPAHIHGISSLGLALTSIASSAMLAMHHKVLGIWGVAISCVVFALRTATRESQLRRAQLRLEYDNQHDHLTGLFNRTFLTDELERQNTWPVGKRWLLFLDLDRFKIINDTLGHEVGDRLLVEVAELLQSVVRSGDIVARFGGDEFVILLNDCQDTGAAERVAERILVRFRSPLKIEQRAVRLTGSIGIAALEDGESTIGILHKADAAMYMAKSLGKNCVRIFDRSILDETARTLELEADLRHAIEDGSITVAYQPIFCAKTKTLVGFEALARWTHSRQGPIRPDDFIPLAEDTGLILELGKQVLQKACRQVAAWNRQFQVQMTVSVNVSGRQLASRDFLTDVSRILRDCPFSPSLLKFEITESVLLDDQASAAEVLSAIRSMGIETYLDDFGTGYSALNYLVEYPFDVIKIDRGFVQNLEHDERRVMMMETIVELARKLGKTVIAEGVETVEQLQLIEAARCDYVQGFLFSMPLFPDVMTEFLSSGVHQKKGLCFPLPQLVPELSPP